LQPFFQAAISSFARFCLCKTLLKTFKRIFDRIDLLLKRNDEALYWLLGTSVHKLVVCINPVSLFFHFTLVK
jgi:hypothetical protein